MINRDLIKNAEQIANDCQVCSAASVNENGYPRICYLTPLANQGIKEFWFSTGTNSMKVQHYKRNPKASVSIQRGGDSITLTGTMEIVDDPAVKDSLWQQWLAKHFPNGGKNDPNYCVIHFISSKGTLYIDDAFETGQIP